MVGNILLTFFLFSTVSCVAQIVDGIAAVVDGQVITFSQVKHQVDAVERRLRDEYKGQDLVDKVKEARLNALRALVERQLIIQDFNKTGYFIPVNVIEDRLKAHIQDNYDGDRTALIRTLQAQGMSLDNFKKELKENLIVQAMRAKNVSNAVIISPFKVEQYYQDNIRQFIQPEEIKLSLIYMRRSLYKEKGKNEKGQEIEYDPVAKVMDEILYKIDTGSKFEDLAKSYSEGVNRDQGGGLEWRTKEELNPVLREVAFKLKPGQISRVILAEDGYYVVRVDDYRRSRAIPLNDIRADIERTLVNEERQRLQQEWLDSLRSRYFIKMF